MLYIFVFVFLALVNTLVVGAWVIDKYGINKWYYKYGILLIGAAVFALVTIVNLIVGFFVLGTLIHAGMEKWRK